MKNNYVDSCRTLKILKQDSGLLPKPRDNYNTFEPKQGDLAYVLEDNSEYEFNGQEWVKKEKEEEITNLTQEEITNEVQG